MNCDNYSDVQAEESCLKGQAKDFMKFYQKNIIEKKDHSFLIIDKAEKLKNRLFICIKGEKCERVMLNY